MPAIDLSRLSAQQRIDLIGELCDSLEDAAAPLTTAQQAELDRRAAALDQDIEPARSAEDVLADLRRRYR
jgi:putative addiction module component (TIGR02574 family)